MKITSCRSMQEAEGALIASGIDAQSLMVDASGRIASAIASFFPAPGHCHAYLGKGNNAGDAVTVLYFLSLMGWHISLTSLFEEDSWSQLLTKQHSLIAPLPSVSYPPPQTTLILDGILGLGASGDLRPPISEAVESINLLRRNTPRLHVWSIDIPTGLDGDTGIPSSAAITADFTSVIGCVKQGMLTDEATAHVGRLVPIPMPQVDDSAMPPDQVLDAEYLAPLLPRHAHDLYKNQAGHVGVIAGSVGMTGAARLCAEASLRAGAGLVTLYCLPGIYAILASSCTPEIMVRPLSSYAEISTDKHASLLIGPGLGTIPSREKTALIHLILHSGIPTVLDADGLNLAASARITLPENVLATPHHGEMMRLLGRIAPPATRLGIARAFTDLHPATLIYKGARSIITQADEPIYYNSSGSSAMATAGQGDVLAGVCAGLCAQGLSLMHAACLGTYLCGTASESMLAAGLASNQTLTASDTLCGLADAFTLLSPYTPHDL